CQQYNDLLSF
nr:immunoglobulin light chain junction region [Macaca mulatta]MOW51941.1 immunoglobulin light chain junction region [Macaca mulatta]